MCYHSAEQFVLELNERCNGIKPYFPEDISFDTRPLEVDI